MPYREVMARVLERLGAPADEREALGDSLPSWPVFPEVPAALEQARARGWKLCILSNTDRDFIDASMTAIGVPFDRSIVAGEIGSYKPALGHWQAFESRTSGGCRTSTSRPASSTTLRRRSELGIPCIWINRLGERRETGTPRRASCRLSSSLAEVLDELAA